MNVIVTLSPERTALTGTGTGASALYMPNDGRAALGAMALVAASSHAAADRTRAKSVGRNRRRCMGGSSYVRRAAWGVGCVADRWVLRIMLRCFDRDAVVGQTT